MESLLSPPPPLLNHYNSVHHLDTDQDSLFTNQILDIMFESHPDEKLGFGVRIDETKKILQINNIDHDGEAYNVGLCRGDIIIAVNDIDIGSNPQIGIQQLKNCKSKTEMSHIRVTIVRRMFDHIMIKIQRSGLESCNGKYHSRELDDEYDSPIFEHEDSNMILCKANYDIETGESLWTISDELHNYYIGVSLDLMPPNDSWNPIKKVGKYPCPGLVFYNTQQHLFEVEDEEKSDEESVVNEEDEEMDIGESYENYVAAGSAKKRMSKLQFNALNDPSLLSHSAVVYEHMQHLNVNVNTDDNDDAVADNEWRLKYDELLVKYKESEQNVKILRGNLRDLNSSFYEFWLRDKEQGKENESLLQRIMDQNKELFEQNKAEIKFINQIKEKRKENVSKIDSLYDIDLDELFANELKLEIENQNDVHIESEINALKQEISALQLQNAKINGLYSRINRLQDENMKIDGLYQEINNLKHANIDIEEKRKEKETNNGRLRKILNDLESENGRIIESKLSLIYSTAQEIVKLKNIINAILNISDINNTVITKMLGKSK